MSGTSSVRDLVSTRTRICARTGTVEFGLKLLSLSEPRRSAALKEVSFELRVKASKLTTWRVKLSVRQPENEFSIDAMV